MLQMGIPVVLEFFLAFLAILIISCYCCYRFRKRGGNQQVLREVHTIERVSTPEKIMERERIVERVLVVCPYCGHKNEQGMSKCAQCGADI
ncbi:MAG: zinc-ribbon domain-containing protein [Promethearchaeota archaeon]